ncbi:MAG: YIP1 family protein [Candidatus Aminicenantes bacterium]|nr:YIP1 family protein [Candidatus Aminicenantes bacterium]
MNLPSRIQGVFFEPRTTLRAVAAKPVWTDVLAVTLIALAVYTIFIMPYASREAFSHYQAQGQEAPDLSRMPKWLLVIPVLIGLFSMTAVVFFSSGVVYLMGRLFSPHGEFKAVLAVYLHAGLVDALLGNAVRLAVALTKKSALVVTGPAMFFPEIPPRSFLFLALGSFDFFRLWAFGILACGLAAVFKVEMKKAFLIAFLSWLALASISVGLGGLSMAVARR